ncbi:uncharacterized protein LOC129592592 isoform X2 [Paramacrobiotus metropolitanus]|uniref:uncharacterized protein LOC129592592 isoform X2 n=1 Tax=Paramacrobiotus metropolitanus TaxID=2943436 RepID=UPI00244582CA|nr:uncharacterized protein LOC129592592 isoform X2 [Paramacrobiotus metropolitanus]
MRKVGAEWINNDYNTDIEVFVPQGVLSEFLEKGQLVHITFPVLQADGELMDRAATISARRLADNGDYIIIHCFKPVDAEGDRVIEGLTVQLVYNDIHFWRMRQALYKVQNDSMCMSPQVLDAVLGRWALADEALTSASSSASADSGISVRQFSVAEHASDVADEEIEEEVNEIEAPPLRTITTTQRINRAPRPFHTEYEESVLGFRNFCFNAEHLPVNNVLNAKQKEAVQMALINPVSLIQGPPGTGKTKTAVAIIRSLLQDPLAKILVCAPSNVAIDDLTLKTATADRGLKILRLLPHGRDIACVNRDVEQYTVNSKFRREFPDFSEPEPWRIRRFELECVEQAQIVCTTCNSAGLNCLSKVSFPYVLIDEAAQGMEPECLVAITRACEKLILIGDAEQLGAVVRFPNLQGSQLMTSLFERLWGADHCPANVRVTLTQQYRMHPAISMMVSQITYEDQLVDDDGVLNRTSTSSILDEIYTFSTNIHRIKEHDFLTSKGFFGRVNGYIPMVFVDLARNDELAGSGTSFVNMGEAHVIARLVSNLLHRGDEEARRPSSQDIGIITFYNGQRSQLRIDLRRHADAHNLPPTVVTSCRV